MPTGLIYAGDASFLVWGPSLILGFTLTDKKKLDASFFCKADAFGFRDLDSLLSENLLTKLLFDILAVSKVLTFGYTATLALVRLIDDP